VHWSSPVQRGRKGSRPWDQRIRLVWRSALGSRYGHLQVSASSGAPVAEIDIIQLGGFGRRKGTLAIGRPLAPQRFNHRCFLNNRD